MSGNNQINRLGGDETRPGASYLKKSNTINNYFSPRFLSQGGDTIHCIASLMEILVSSGGKVRKNTLQLERRRQVVTPANNLGLRKRIGMWDLGEVMIYNLNVSWLEVIQQGVGVPRT